MATVEPIIKDIIKKKKWMKSDSKATGIDGAIEEDPCEKGPARLPADQICSEMTRISSERERSRILRLVDDPRWKRETDETVTYGSN